MKGFGAIYRRELAGLFLAPLAWILLCLTLLLNAVFFVSALEGTGGDVAVVLAYMHQSWPLWLFACMLPPLITMRMISEESKSGLLEFLLTAPVSDGAVVVGKMLAATTFLALVWASVPLYALVVHLLGAPPDWGQVLTSWLGAVLLFALFSSIGLVASALSSTPLLAAFFGILANIAVLLAPQLLLLVRGGYRELARDVGTKINVVAHLFPSFFRGALDSAHVAFFLAWILAILFVAVRLVESKRWAS